MKPESTFPYRDIAEAEKSTDEEVLFRLELLRVSFSKAADEAWSRKDYRLHAIYSMTSNKFHGMLKEYREGMHDRAVRDRKAKNRG